MTWEALARHRARSCEWGNLHKDRANDARRARRLIDPSKFRAQAKKWRANNPGKVSQYNRKWREAHPEDARLRLKAWHKLHPGAYKTSYAANPGKFKARRARYYEGNKTKVLRKNYQYQKLRAKTDPKFRALKNLRTRMRDELRRPKGSGSTLPLLGCSKELFIQHIEKRFSAGMSWDNYGLWHLDHALPCAAFDLTDMAQAKKCFNYTNIQPLWAKDNQSKAAKIPVEDDIFA